MVLSRVKEEKHTVSEEKVGLTRFRQELRQMLFLSLLKVFRHKEGAQLRHIKLQIMPLNKVVFLAVIWV